MPAIAAFHAIRYDTAVCDLASVVAPPYDVISEHARVAYETSSPYSAVRLVLPRDSTGGDSPGKYTQARATLDTWLAAGVLRRDAAPSLTLYEQRYLIGGEARSQRGILAAVRLDDPADGGVLPHERTYDSIVGDRLALLRATEMNLDCTFCVYDGPDDAAARAIDDLAASEPASRFTTADDGTEHVLWHMTDPASIAAVAASMEKATVVIADGHHRWRTALTYRDEQRAQHGSGPWDEQLMLLVDASRHGPSLLPIHRVVQAMDADDALARLRECFSIEAVPRDDPEALALSLVGGAPRAYVMLDGARAWRLTLTDRDAERAAMPPERSAAWRDLDVAVLHRLVFDRLLGGVDARFVHSATEAAEATIGGSVAFLIAPMRFESVRAVAEAGEAMPQKSTYFIPKPKTGVVFRSLAP